MYLFKKKKKVIKWEAKIPKYLTFGNSYSGKSGIGMKNISLSGKINIK